MAKDVDAVEARRQGLRNECCEGERKGIMRKLFRWHVPYHQDRHDAQQHLPGCIQGEDLQHRFHEVTAPGWAGGSRWRLEPRLQPERLRGCGAGGRRLGTYLNVALPSGMWLECVQGITPRCCEEIVPADQRSVEPDIHLRRAPQPETPAIGRKDVELLERPYIEAHQACSYE